MAPLRRYLRISKYSVLEVRIYLDQPALAHSWLLNPRKPVLPRVIEAIRPLVLPKLREENERERSRAKGKKKGIKDVVVEDDFEVSIFLTEASTRHSLLVKQKHFRNPNPKKHAGAGATSDAAIEVDNEPGADIPVLREESDEDMAGLREIPAAEMENVAEQRRRSKRRRVAGSDEEDDGDAYSLFVEDDDAPDQEGDLQALATGSRTMDAVDHTDDKKMVVDSTYEGFAIYGRVLCLVIKRREMGKGKLGMSGGGQAAMEEWIVSTQMLAMGEDLP